MSQPPASPPPADYATVGPRLSWRFPATFWVANIAELLERAAFYGMFIALSLYLSRVVGFTDVQAGWVSACFSFLLYLLPPFMGTLADTITFRRALILAFMLLTVGYAALGFMPARPVVLSSLLFIAAGGAIVKPVILGTAAKCSDTLHRARAFSIFYFMVNLGAFSGKTIAAPLRTGFDMPFYGRLELGLVYINYYAALMALLAVILVAVAYRNPDVEGAGRPFGDVLASFLRVLSNGRFMLLILIVAGFWMIQGQLYASMPKYTLRMVGEHARPEWLANINPFIVVLCVVPVTHLVRRWKPENSIAIALALAPLSAAAIGLGPFLQDRTGSEVSFGLFTLHPFTVALCLGIALQGFAECFLAPKFMEYASAQAPRGEEGLYMGFQNLPVAISWLVGFILSGYLLDTFCPDPEKLRLTDPIAHAQWQAALDGHAAMPAAYASANYIWFVFAGVGVLAMVALLIFNRITSRIDRAAG